VFGRLSDAAERVMAEQEKLNALLRKLIAGL
jgi:hypothetical protein